MNENHELFSEHTFKHFKCDKLALAVEGDNHIKAFGVRYNHSKEDGTVSDAVRELNGTLWNPTSRYRPDGWLIADSFDINWDESVCIFVEGNWFIGLNIASQDEYRESWKDSYFSDGSGIEDKEMLSHATT